MKSEVIDTVFADPPFNIGKDYKNGYNDKMTKSEYLIWCREWILECCRILKPGGAFFLYATPELAVQFAPIMGEQLDFRHWIALTMKGTYPRGKKLYPAHYALLYYTRGTPRVFNKLRLPIETCRHCGREIRDYGGHRNKMNPAGVNLTDFWTDTSPNRHKKFKVRPGVNELKLVIPERAILISTEPGDTVFDPFGGVAPHTKQPRSSTATGSALSFMTQRIFAGALRRIIRFSPLKNRDLISRLFLIMKISKIQFYGGSMEKVCRLGLAQLFLELQEILLTTEVLVLNKKQANGAGRVREMIDEQFGNYSDWVQSKTGDVDWVKRLRYNQTILSRMGVEIQVSGRSDLLARDIHLRKQHFAFDRSCCRYAVQWSTNYERRSPTLLCW